MSDDKYSVEELKDELVNAGTREIQLQARIKELETRIKMVNVQHAIDQEEIDRLLERGERLDIQVLALSDRCITQQRIRQDRQEKYPQIGVPND